MDQLIHDFIYITGYFTQFIFVVLYFLFLYFILGHLFLYTCRIFAKKGWLEKISLQKVTREQYLFEKKNALISILVFGISGFMQIYLIRISWIELSENTLLNIVIGLIILSIWNEVHFFAVHRLLHTPFLMRNVHKIHHQSIVPTVYSSYCFHWFEAFLLSTLPLTIAPFLNFAPFSLLLYPMLNILLNFAGHSNYKFKQNFTNKYFTSLGIRHNYHHIKFSKNYGFASSLFDKLLGKIKLK